MNVAFCFRVVGRRGLHLQLAHKKAQSGALRCSLYAAWTVAAALITVFALFSFDATEWGTRAKKPAPAPESQPGAVAAFAARSSARSKELLPEALTVTTSAGD